MKNQLLLYTSVLTMILASCKSATIYMTQRVPATIDISTDHKSVLLLDRTGDENKEGKIIDGILKGDFLSSEDEKKQHVISGLYDKLLESTEFTVVKATEIMQKDSLEKESDTPLSQEKIAQLCEKYFTDAVMVIEDYETKFNIDKGMRPPRNGTLLPTFYVDVRSEVNANFRTYSNVIKDDYIIEAFPVQHFDSWNVTGMDAQSALSKVQNKDETDKIMSYKAGQKYGARYIATYKKVARMYYKKGSEDIARGARFIEIEDWSGALNTLHEGYFKTNSNKEKGYLAHNLAVVYEMLGDYPQASKWANDAYVIHGNKDSREYSQILRNKL